MYNIYRGYYDSGRNNYDIIFILYDHLLVNMHFMDPKLYVLVER